MSARFPVRIFSLILFVAFVPAACSKPTADDHLKKGEAYVKDAKLPEATIEYRAALQADPKRGDIRLKLADAYMAVGDIRNGLGESVRAADLLPKDAAAQLRAGNLLLVARSFEDAKARANNALALDPTNAEALILLGNAFVGLRDMDSAMAEYQQAITLNPDQDSAYMSLGSLQSIKGQAREAEASFKKAIEVAPKSMTPRLSLANFLWAAGRTPEAEQALKDALTLEPANLAVNRALGTFYLGSGRIAEAEPYFQTIARTTNTPEALINLADYYAVSRRYDEARKILTDLVPKEDLYASVMTRLAAMDARENQREQALTKLKDVLDKHPKEMPARLLRARLLVADGKNEEALADTEAIVRDEPNSPVAPAALLLTGSIYATADRSVEAINAYEEVLKLQAQPLAANVALAALHLDAGSVEKAATYAQQALSNQPANPLARAVMVRVLLAQGETGKAKEALASLQKEFPTSPTVLNLVAAQQLASRQVDGARATYAKVVALVPNDIEATNGLVRIDLSNGRVADAVARIEAGLKAPAPTADFLILGARTYGAAGQPQKAEELLKRAIEVAPGRMGAYEVLGQFYVGQQRLEDAEKQYQRIVERNPTSVSANTMLGLVYEVQRHLSEAEAQYQKVLALDPNAAVAANNLAWMYVSGDRKLDEALQLALAAKRSLPDDPRVNDTLGWTYYKKGLFDQAVRALTESVVKAPTEPAGHYHLGLAYVKTGNFDKARLHLRETLKLKPDFPEAADIRKALADIGV